MSFKLPIHYCSKKTTFSNLYDDLELLEKGNMYKYLFKPSTILGEQMLKQWSEFYTTDTAFLKDSQHLYDSLDNTNVDKECTEQMWKMWNNIKKEDNFLEKYQYIDWSKLKWLNKYTPFLSFISLYNLISPLLNLILPIVMLIIPFFLLKIMRIPITFSSYKKILLEQIRNHSVGQFFTQFKHVEWDKRVYILVSLGIYLFNIYQNIVSCCRFYLNMKTINTYFTLMEKYIKYTVQKMNIVIQKASQLSTYKPFITNMLAYKSKLIELAIQLPKNHNVSPKSLLKIGKTMKIFYLLYSEDNYNDLLSYSFDFNGYWDTIVGLHKNKSVHNASFNGSNVSFKNTFYPSLNKPIKNDISFKKNIIITGPNASGKTTLLKCCVLNLLFTQQVGKGFYDKAKIKPFDYIHCYLNIPDTSSRDSLFQAEARRCKEILNFIELFPNKKHFCIFDELYSGTNPYEAIGSAYSYLKFISKNKRVRFMLTTHFIQLCSLFEKEKNIINWKMKPSRVGEKIIHSYKIVRGISKIRGGICVLKELHYPIKILKETESIIRTL